MQYRSAKLWTDMFISSVGLCFVPPEHTRAGKF